MVWPRRASLRLQRASRNSLPAWQRATSWFSIALYAALAFGIPLPLDAGPKSGEVYPCMNHRCGCHSAEQCWRDCCCMSMAEKLAWARENNVAPPDYVLAEVASQGLLDEAPPAKCCCCHAKPAKSCCEMEAAASCCQSPETNASDQVASKPALRGIVLLSALKCRGVADSWTGAPISLSPPTPIIGAEVSEFVGAVIELEQEFSTRAISTPTPPPRFCAA